MEATGWLTYDDFADRVGEQFELRGPEGASVSMELAEVTQGAELGGPGPDGQARVQFSLLFKGPSDPVLTQGTRALTHPALGELALFLVPIGADAHGIRYEAAFA